MTGSKSTIKNGKKYCLFFIKYQFKVFFFQTNHTYLISYTTSQNDILYGYDILLLS